MSSALYHRSVSVRPAVYAALRRAAIERGMSVAALVEEALRPLVENPNCDCTVCHTARKHPQLNAPRCWEGRRRGKRG